MDIQAFEKLLVQLGSDLDEARRNGDTRIPSIITPDVLIFDIGQEQNPATSRREWDNFTTRQQIEITFSAFPDHLMRDRIHIPPQYLNVHFHDIELTFVEFRELLKRTKGIEGVKEVYPEQNFTRRRHDLFQGITRSMCEQGVPDVLFGERVLINVPLKLASDGWFFIKLMIADEKRPYLAFTFQPEDYSFTFGIAMRIAKCFAQA